VSEKTLRSTVSLTAARGRGKSAALGLAMAGAVAFGYSNIFVTSPSPENLTTLFEFVFKGNNNRLAMYYISVTCNYLFVMQRQK
jgi:N-acetyltransferase 10